LQSKWRINRWKLEIAEFNSAGGRGLAGGKWYMVGAASDKY
jgi:hypothetical protein